MLIPGPMGQLGPSMGGGLGGSGSPAQGLPLMPVVHYVQTNPGGVQNQGPNQGGNQPHYTAHNPGGTRFRKREQQFYFSAFIYTNLYFSISFQSFNVLFLL